ncbi:MAG TPA: hypothetical protein VL357_09280 [Rariglobus sp.]|jgi:hypothetical protein|nr:hypothetical protein [Rariglobus sp.]
MWQKIKDQFPAILATVILVGLILGGYACYVNFKVIPDLNAERQREITDLKEQHAAELQASAEQTRRQIEAVNTLLKDAIAKRSADALMTDEEFAQANAAKVNQLAEAIAQKIQPFNPLPKTPEEAERLQNEQVDKVSSRLSEKIQPILADIAKDQNLTRESLSAYSQKIADQVGVVLTAELAKNQVLNNNLTQAHSLAEQSLALSHELAALYLSSMKDEGVLTRILSLPANVIKDASHLSIVNSSDRKKKEQELVDRMNAIQKQLDDIQAANPKK